MSPRIEALVQVVLYVGQWPGAGEVVLFPGVREPVIQLGVVVVRGP